MPERKSEAIWNGGLKNGKGTVKLGSGIFQGPYSFQSRFEQGQGTNPEELIAAAHAGCFSMALSMLLEQAGYKPEQIKTTANVHIDKSGDGFRITKSELECDAQVPGINDTEFQKQADAAKKNCPVSQALGGVQITLKTRLATLKA
ncbi:MAG: OsmC family protein [Actinomycetota bacterium]|nr:OsmC family protein [Actinomycetota bacterium]